MWVLVSILISTHSRVVIFMVERLKIDAHVYPVWDIQQVVFPILTRNYILNGMNQDWEKVLMIILF